MKMLSLSLSLFLALPQFHFFIRFVRTHEYKRRTSYKDRKTECSRETKGERKKKKLQKAGNNDNMSYSPLFT